MLVLPIGCPCSVRFFGTVLLTKSQSSRYSLGLGAVVTTDSDWSILLDLSIPTESKISS